MADRIGSILALTKARFLEFWREPGALFWTFGFPILLALGLGLAFRDRELPKPRVATTESAPTWITQALESDDDLQVISLPDDELDRALRTGRIDLLIDEESIDAAAGRVTPPTHPSPTGDRTTDPRLRYRYDPMRVESRTAHLLTSRTLERAKGRVDLVSVRHETKRDVGARYIDWLFPGLIGLNIMASSLWFIGYALVLARKRRLLKVLAATPMRRTDLLLAQINVRLIFLVLELVALMIFGALVFGIEIQGSAFAVAFITLLGAAAFGGIALVVAARLESVEAANGWLNAIILPMWVSSGSFFSYERFPEVMWPLLRALPLTALNDALRSITQEGQGLIEQLPEIGVLSAWLIISSALAFRFFRWQ